MKLPGITQSCFFALLGILIGLINLNLLQILVVFFALFYVFAVTGYAIAQARQSDAMEKFKQWVSISFRFVALGVLGWVVNTIMLFFQFYGKG